MKKIIYLGILLLGIQSCKSEVSPCACADIGLEMYQKMKATNFDPNQMAAVEKEFKVKLQKCDEKIESLTKLESEKFEEEMKECDSYKQIMKEAYSK